MPPNYYKFNSKIHTPDSASARGFRPSQIAESAVTQVPFQQQNYDQLPSNENARIVNSHRNLGRRALDNQFLHSAESTMSAPYIKASEAESLNLEVVAEPSIVEEIEVENIINEENISSHHRLEEVLNRHEAILNNEMSSVAEVVRANEQSLQEISNIENQLGQLRRNNFPEDDVIRLCDQAHKNIDDLKDTNSEIRQRYEKVLEIAQNAINEIRVGSYEVSQKIKKGTIDDFEEKVEAKRIFSQSTEALDEYKKITDVISAAIHNTELRDKLIEKVEHQIETFESNDGGVNYSAELVNRSLAEIIHERQVEDAMNRIAPILQKLNDRLK